MPLRLLALALAASLLAGPSLAQQTNESGAPQRKVLAKRVCDDGSTTLAVATGDMIILEFYSAPRPDGTVSGYEDAYDRANYEEARAQFQALRCPEGK